MSAVLHQPRIAWDAATLLIRTAQAESTVYTWCRDRIGAVLGSEYQQNLDATRDHLTAPLAPVTAKDVQAAIWRVKLEDELRTQPDLAGDLARFTADLRAHLAP